MNILSKVFRFYLFTCGVFTLQFIKYLFDNNQVLSMMDAGGWAFYLTSCISHSACIALLPFLVYLLLSLVHLPRVACFVSITLGVLLSGLISINGEVYQIYRFHINGFVWNMITGPSAKEIFTFDVKLYLHYLFLFSFFLLVYMFYWKGCVLSNRRTGTSAKKHSSFWKRASILFVLIGSTLFAHIYHIFASFYEKQSVIMSERLLPYYFPATSYSFLTDKLKLKAPIHDKIVFSEGGDMQKLF